MRKVLIAIASESDGHAAADAVQASVPSFTKENIEALIIEVLTDDSAEAEVNVRRITESKGNIYHVWGHVWGEEFAAIVAPIKFKHLGTCTG